MPQVITVEITPQGVATVTSAGFSGASCTQATAALEKALGKVTADQKTPEFHQGATCKLPQQQKAGQ